MDATEPSPVTQNTDPKSHAYWAGRLSEDLRSMLVVADPAGVSTAAAALAEFDAWCADRQKDGRG